MAALELQPFFFYPLLYLRTPPTLLALPQVLPRHGGCVSMCASKSGLRELFFHPPQYIVFSIWRPENKEACQLGGW